jgi:hypothetical protein
VDDNAGGCVDGGLLKRLRGNHSPALYTFLPPMHTWETVCKNGSTLTFWSAGRGSRWRAIRGTASEVASRARPWTTVLRLMTSTPIAMNAGSSSGREQLTTAASHLIRRRQRAPRRSLVAAVGSGKCSSRLLHAPPFGDRNVGADSDGNSCAGSGSCLFVGTPEKPSANAD